jgi:hypothetical protein
MEPEGKGKVVPALNEVPRHEDVWRSGGIAPQINLSTRWEWSASRPSRFAPWKEPPVSVG